MNIKNEDVAKLGAQLKGQLDQFIADRNLCELQWLKNLRQYAGKYDPDVAAAIPDDKSHAYPRDTRVKVKGGVAKMMEMMFPSQEKNWELEVTPVPSIPEDALQNIIDTLTLQEQQAAEAEQRAPGVIASEAIERAVRAFADKRKDKMEAEIADQLADPGTDYPQLCKRVVRSGYIYGFGIVRSPMVRTQQERVWEYNPTLGKYEAKVVTLRRPYPEYVRIWDAYPDMSAKSWEDQEMFFEKIVMTRHDFSELAKRKDFMKEAVRGYLRDNPSGNYTAKTFETELQQLAKTGNLADRTARRYEAYRGVGFISAHTLQAAGVTVKEEELDQDIFAELWFIDDVVIKADKAAFGDRPSDQYHAFIYTEDEDSGLTGVGLTEEVRDSQMCLCATTRMLMDNAAAIAGPIFEVNRDLLPRGRKEVGTIHAFKVIEREGTGPEAQFPAVRDIPTQSHIAELLSTIAMFRQQLDIESNLPAFTLGGIQQQPLGEAFRTTNNMSMMMGSANMLTKDTVRAFDKFTTSLLTSFLRWNMEFNPKQEIKGDYQVSAKGVRSLVAKEVRGAALDQFVTTLTPEERAILDTYGVLIDRLKSRDLPVDRVLPKDEAEQILKSMREGQAQAAQVEQGLTQAKTADAEASAMKKQVDAQLVTQTTEAAIQEILSRVEQNLSLAQSAGEKTQLENLKILLSAATEKPTEKASA